MQALRIETDSCSLGPTGVIHIKCLHTAKRDHAFDFIVNINVIDLIPL